MGRRLRAHLQKNGDNDAFEAVKNDLIQKSGKRQDRKCSGQLLCKISTRASERGSRQLIFPILPFFSPHVTWVHPPGPPPSKLHENGAILSFLHFGIYLAIFNPCIYIDMRHLMQTLNLFTKEKCSSDLKCLLFDTFVWIFSTKVDKSLILTKYQEQQKPFLLCFI